MHTFQTQNTQTKLYLPPNPVKIAKKNSSDNQALRSAGSRSSCRHKREKNLNMIFIFAQKIRDVAH